MKKTPTGFEFFDTRYGGIYEGRAVLLSGARGAGKTIFSLQFLKRGLDLRQPALILSARPAVEVARCGQRVGIDVDRETENNRLFILNYGEVVGNNGREQDIMLPPEGFAELKDLIERKGIERVALDTVLPWMNLTTKGHLAEHVFSFVRAFERMQTAAVFTLFYPNSPAAWKLHSLLEEAVPVSVAIDYDPAAGTRYWQVRKYDVKFDKEQEEAAGKRIKIDPNTGVVVLNEQGEDWERDYTEPPAVESSDGRNSGKSAFAAHWRVPEREPANSAGPWPEREEDSDVKEKNSPAEEGEGNKREEDQLNLRPDPESADSSHDLRTPFARAMFRNVK